MSETPAVNPACSICAEPAKENVLLKYRQPNDARSRDAGEKAGLGRFKESGYYLCSSCRCSAKEKVKGSNTDYCMDMVAGGEGYGENNCEYHSKVKANDRSRPRKKKKTDDQPGSLPVTSTSQPTSQPTSQSNSQSTSQPTSQPTTSHSEPAGFSSQPDGLSNQSGSQPVTFTSQPSSQPITSTSQPNFQSTFQPAGSSSQTDGLGSQRSSQPAPPDNPRPAPSTSSQQGLQPERPFSLLPRQPDQPAIERKGPEEEEERQDQVTRFSPPSSVRPGSPVRPASPALPASSLNPSIYWIEKGGDLNNLTIKGSLVFVRDGAMLIMPANASMVGDELLRTGERLRALIDVTKEGRVDMLDRVSTSWGDCMSCFNVSDPPHAIHLAAHQASPSETFSVDFARTWRRYCRGWDNSLLRECLAREHQSEVRYEKCMVVHSDDLDLHCHAALAHGMTTSVMIIPGYDDFEGYRYASTAGALYQLPVDVPRLLQLRAGRLLVFLDAALAVLTAGDELVIRPGSGIEIYSVEPTILDVRGFLDYRCILSLVPALPKQTPALLLMLCHMSIALSNDVWCDTLGSELMGYLETMLKLVNGLEMEGTEEEIRKLAIKGLERKMNDITPLPIAMDVD